MNGASRVVVLVAEDEELVRNMIAVMVESDGHSVLTASNGSEALELSRRHDGHIHLLISDVQMPGLNGVELAAALATERPQTKVLLISGRTEIQIPRGIPFLRKPFTAAALQRVMAGLLAPIE